jgi:hypothetical protein
LFDIGYVICGTGGGYWFVVASLIFVVARFWSFVKLWHIPLLLELTEMLDLGLAKFHELFV